MVTARRGCFLGRYRDHGVAPRGGPRARCSIFYPRVEICGGPLIRPAPKAMAWFQSSGVRMRRPETDPLIATPATSAGRCPPGAGCSEQRRERDCYVGKRGLLRDRHSWVVGCCTCAVGQGEEASRESRVVRMLLGLPESRRGGTIEFSLDHARLVVLGDWILTRRGPPRCSDRGSIDAGVEADEVDVSDRVREPGDCLRPVTSNGGSCGLWPQPRPERGDIGEVERVPPSASLGRVRDRFRSRPR